MVNTLKNHNMLSVSTRPVVTLRYYRLSRYGVLHKLNVCQLHIIGIGNKNTQKYHILEMHNTWHKYVQIGATRQL